MAAATKPAAEAQEASEGLSLAQYAAVRAALAEGFPLADVLAVEGLRPRAFARADLAWKQRLVAEPALLATYQQELARAEDWLERSVEPLAEDATAWASFLAAFGAHPAPFELLEERDLGTNDVARLRRRWARRAEEDASVGELLLEVRVEPGKLGPLRVGPRVLRPSRVAAARGPAEAPAREPTAASPPREPALGLAEYAAVCAELAALPEQRARVLRRHGLSDEEALAALDRPWREALARDAALAKDFARLEAHHARRLEMLLARARQVADASREAALSFPQSSASAAVKPPSPVLAETCPCRDVPASRPAPRPPSELGETSLRLEIPRELLRQTARGQAAVTGAASESSRASPPPSPSSKTGNHGPATLPERLEMILPLARYAALCAELALFPEAAEAIFQRYGLGSSEMRSAVDAAWKARLRDHPTEYTRWQELYWRRHAHLAKRGTPAG
ncbi:hypothetical protein ACMHYB_01325 [Sorangium sp. So ce1128]